MPLDYKISREIRDGKTTKVLVRITEGEMRDVTDPDSGKVSSVYVRAKTLEEREISFDGDIPKEKVVAYLNGYLVAIGNVLKKSPIAVQVADAKAEKPTPVASTVFRQDSSLTAALAVK